MHHLYAGLGAVKIGMTGSASCCLTDVMDINKYMIAVTGRTVDISLGRDGIFHILPVAVMAGGAGTVAVGRHVMDRINVYHSVKTRMTGSTCCSNRHLMGRKMARRGDREEMAIFTGYIVAIYPALDLSIIGRV